MLLQEILCERLFCWSCNVTAGSATLLLQDIHLGEYLMSNDIISMALATVAQKPALNVILKELQSEPGQELYVFPAERYLRWELQLLFATAGNCAICPLSPTFR